MSGGFVTGGGGCNIPRLLVHWDEYLAVYLVNDHSAIVYSFITIYSHSPYICCNVPVNYIVYIRK